MPLLVAAELYANEARCEAEVGAAAAGDRRDPGSGPDWSGEAAAYGEADLRAAARRARVWRRLYGGEGLCPDRPSQRTDKMNAAPLNCKTTRKIVPKM